MSEPDKIFLGRREREEERRKQEEVWQEAGMAKMAFCQNTTTTFTQGDKAETDISQRPRDGLRLDRVQACYVPAGAKVSPTQAGIK